MNCKQLLLATSVALTLATSSVMAGEIYRWTDAEGNVHYGDKPSGAASETRVHIASTRTDNSSVQARVQARREAATTKKEAAAAEPAAPTRAEKRASRQEKEQLCQSYRAKLETMVTSRRLFRADENGERVYLDDAEIDEARSKAQELIDENCS